VVPPWHSEICPNFARQPRDALQPQTPPFLSPPLEGFPLFTFEERNVLQSRFLVIERGRYWLLFFFISFPSFSCSQKDSSFSSNLFDYRPFPFRILDFFEDPTSLCTHLGLVFFHTVLELVVAVPFRPFSPLLQLAFCLAYSIRCLPPHGVPFSSLPTLPSRTPRSDKRAGFRAFFAPQSPARPRPDYQ